MTQGFTTYHPIRGKEPFLRSLACEVRFNDGQLYLDRSGKILRHLLTEAPEWVLVNDPTPQAVGVYNIRAGTQLGMSIRATNLALDKSSSDDAISSDEVADFLEQVGFVLEFVLDELEVSDFTRLGYREQYHFAFKTKEESEKWIRELGLFHVAPAVFAAFGAKPEVFSGTLLMEGEDCRYRLAVNGIERSAQIPVGDTMINVRTTAVKEKQRQALLGALKKERQRQMNAGFAAVVDIDAYLENPGEIKAATFAQEHAKTCLENFRKALSLDQSPKKGGG